MSSPVVGLRVAASVFAVVTLGHLLRFVTQLSILVAGREVPLWVNLLGAVFAGTLSLWMWRLAGRASFVGPATRP